MRARLAGSAWRTAWPLMRGAAPGALLSPWAARSSSAVSSTRASNKTAWLLLSTDSLDEPKRQRFKRAISKFSASIRLCLNVSWPCMRSISARIARSESCEFSSGVSLAGDALSALSGVVSEASSMAKVSLSRARVRARSGTYLQWTNAWRGERDWAKLSRTERRSRVRPSNARAWAHCPLRAP